MWIITLEKLSHRTDCYGSEKYGRYAYRLAFLWSHRPKEGEACTKTHYTYPTAFPINLWQIWSSHVNFFFWTSVIFCFMARWRIHWSLLREVLISSRKDLIYHNKWIFYSFFNRRKILIFQQLFLHLIFLQILKFAFAS